MATGSYANTVRLHLIEDGSAVAVLDHAASATHIAFSPDSTLLAVALDNHTVSVIVTPTHTVIHTHTR